MNLELFIARRLLKGKSRKVVSVPIVKIAVAGISLGVCVMLISVFVITGFKQEITAKLSGFMAHLNITAYDNNDSYSGNGIHLSDTLLEQLRGLPEINQAYPYVNKPTILKSKDEIHGLVFRGVDSTFDASFYLENLRAGEIPDFSSGRPSDEILISASVAQVLNVKPGDRLTAHFVQQPPRVRVFTVKGIYETGFKEYDDLFAVCDVRHLQRLNGWEQDLFTGVAVELKEIGEIPLAEEKVDELISSNEKDDFFKITTLKETAPQIFDWLSLLNMNVVVILVLIVLVAGFNMVSGLLIFILDQTALIGILKALGYKNIALRKLFLYVAMGLILKGMLVGNLLAFLLGGVQHYFSIIGLNPDTYYMDTVPVNFNWWYIILLNAGVLLVSGLMLIVPTMLISSIRPIKAIRFE